MARILWRRDSGPAGGRVERAEGGEEDEVVLLVMVCVDMAVGCCVCVVVKEFVKI